MYREELLDLRLIKAEEKELRIKEKLVFFVVVQ
jgi:hypothetical protein